MKKDITFLELLETFRKRIQYHPEGLLGVSQDEYDKYVEFKTYSMGEEYTESPATLDGVVLEIV